MGGKRTKNKKGKLELDKLSNLPSDVTEQILSYLPIRDAVRSSVLSSKWRHKWATLRRLVFDDKTAIRCVIERVIDHVLLLHEGPVDTFKLSTGKYIKTAEFDRWILYLSRFSVKEFILEKGTSSCIDNISSHLFSYKDLTHLGLKNCSLKPPLTFKGFAMLKSLDIRNVIVAKDVLEKIIVGCPLLETMRILCDLVSNTHLKIDAPNLQFLKVRGVFEEIKLQNTPNLVDVSIDPKMASRSRSYSKLLLYFLSLPRIERLTIDGCLLEVRKENKAAAGEQATNWLNNNRLWEFTQLRRLKVTGLYGVTGEVDLLEYLFLSSPALQELEISFRDKMGMGLDAAAVGDYSNRNCTFNQLRVIKVTKFRGVKAEAGFIGFLLSSSPMLKTMTLQPASTEVSWEVLKVVTEFKRDSGHAELKLLDPLSPLRESYNGSYTDRYLRTKASSYDSSDESLDDSSDESLDDD
ncbi:F-box/FBD/LRR-repeat protein At1g13570-like [Rosa rugosa]|uniref:F-box/FBD/LRR-repeat protein At1g13570-like n=1 Tax=Rosa rugosa TaxID=74645 RepID=UPI002B413AEB|nr:F-box/FBD/LRR-repeat protein At1g13570-like [Rosa rugosa]